MSRDPSPRILSLKLCAGCILILCLLAFAQHQDEKDERAACAHAKQQQRAAAQPDTWAKLNQDARRMTAYEQIK